MAEGARAEEARPEEPGEALGREERRWREQLVAGVLWVVVAAGGLTWLFGITGTNMRWAATPFLILTIAAMIAALLPKLPFFVRGASVVGTLVIGATLALLIYGTGPNAVIALATATATTTMLAGRRAGVWMLAGCTLLLCAIFGANMAGFLDRPEDWYENFDTARPHVAARIVVLFVACTGILALGLSHLVERAESLLAETTRALFDLRRKEAERAALERQVELQRASLRRAEEAEVLFRLGGYAAHDFGNALTVMTGTLEVLRPRAGDDENVREALELLDAAVHTAAQTNEELRSLSGGKTSEGTSFSIEEQVQRLGRMLTFVLPERIRTRVDLGALGPVSCNTTTFHRAIMNLALNARDAMPSGGELSLILRAARSEEVTFSPRPIEDFVCLEVKDTGSGIRPEDQERIFEPYFTTKGGAGTGLGLASVRDSLRALGGEVYVRSEPGKGATFATFWPRLSEQHSDPSSSKDIPTGVVRPA